MDVFTILNVLIFIGGSEVFFIRPIDHTPNENKHYESYLTNVQIWKFCFYFCLRKKKILNIDKKIPDKNRVI